MDWIDLNKLIEDSVQKWREPNKEYWYIIQVKSISLNGQITSAGKI